MTNYKGDGDIVHLTAPSGGVTSGTPVLIGGLLVIPQSDAAVGETFAAKTTGEFEVPKATGAAWTEGEIVHWDVADGEFNTSATGNYAAAAAVADAASGDVLGRVRLQGIAVAAG